MFYDIRDEIIKHSTRRNHKVFYDIRDEIMLTAILVLVKRNNKAVVGSRNEGVSNYVGEGVTCGIQFYFFGYNAPKDALSRVV